MKASVFLVLLASVLAAHAESLPVPDKLVVLTFDDSSKSHFTIARPILKKHGFGATFFITEGWDFRDNKRDYMTWEEIARLHADGFEIGNHTRDHMGVTKANVARLDEQLTAIEDRCAEHGIPKPVTFAWPGNATTPDAFPVLREHGIRFARRGGVPEQTYESGRGFAYQPGTDHPLLLPSAGDAKPGWQLADFIAAVSQARNGRIAVLQFHGVPDTAHLWVSTETRKFETFMQYLADNGFTVVALRDLAKFSGTSAEPADPNAIVTHRKAGMKAGGPLPDGRYLYVATPGIRNYLDYGGHGLLVYAMDENYRFVRRIPTAGLASDGTPSNVKGVCASAATGRLYVSTLQTLTCVDLHGGAILWEKPYDGGCDRIGIAPDGSFLYLPSLEKGHWHVVDGQTGDILARIEPGSGAHNTIVGRNGREAYLAGLRSPLLTVADTATHAAARTVGPFSAPIRPFTVNADQTRVFVCVNDLLGFEIGDLVSGKMLHRVEARGFEKGPVKRHGCPSHGIGMTPDGSQIWLCDGHNSRLHVFNATQEPPKQIASIPVRDQPGWITFSLDGRHALPSTGEIIDTATHQIVATLADETGREVGSEKMVEVHWRNGRVIRCGDQFGYGRE